ncbi:MAG: ABC transporter substrate-binding protein [Flavobacteriales bacterium]|nr:ABC transporter substrate-binding protein [Flavobacteriales bacterium]
MKNYYTSFLFLFLLTLLSCQQTPPDQSTKRVIIRERSDASTLNPIGAGDQLSVYAGQQIYQSLLSIDYKTEKIVGIIAESAPDIELRADQKMILTYTIRPEARFDNGRSISSHDILFSLKLNICPLINNMGGVFYYEFIEDFIIKNERQFQIICKNAVVLNQFRSGDFAIMPPETYDSTGLLSSFSLKRLKQDKQLQENDSIILLSESVNNSINQSTPKYFVGSGAYQLKKWQKAERIILERKKNWWGKKLEGENSFFNAFADEIQFEIINDPVTAINALKAKQIDFMYSLNAKDYLKLKDHESIETKSIQQHGYQYLGFNCNDPILSDKNVRKAIEACIPYDKIIEIVFKNEAIINRLPLALSMKSLRNTSIHFEGYNLEMAKKILTESGWKDTDGDNILDKQNTALQLSYYYNSGNEDRKSIGLLLQNELKKLGVILEVKSLEWTSYLKALRNNEIQIFMNGSISVPLPPDFSSTFHSKFANGGRNYANYQNPHLDTLIDSINIELNEVKRIELIKEAQVLIAEETPYVFLVTTNTRMAYSNRLQNVPIYSIRPNFWAPEIY